jgi:urease accessory protein
VAATASTPVAADTPAADTGWLGRLALDYRVRGGRTVLAHRRHEGPLLIQRNFHPEGNVCHSYVIHPPGGVAGGDRLQLDASVGAGGHALLTTPAAAKFYRTDGAVAAQEQVFDVGADAALEVLPMESILHRGCAITLDNRFRLAADARLCAWDILCLGRPGSGDHFETGRCRQQWRIERGGETVLHECLNLAAGDPLLQRPWGLDGYPVIATLVATPAPEGVEQALREQLDPASGRLGITRIGDVLLLRALASGAEAARALLQNAWTLLREPVLGRTPCPPRIWKT